MLHEIESALLAAKPRFRFEAPASEADLANLRSAIPADAPDVIAWFAWHAGSQDGFLPESSVRMIGLKKARDEMRFLAANPSTPPLPPGSCPLLEDGGGGLWIYVARDGGELWRYERGSIQWTKPFAPWLSELLEIWRSERGVLRVDFLRRSRSMLGWQQLEVPTRGKKRVVAWLRKPEGALVIRSPGERARLTIGPSVAWDEAGADFQVVLTQEAATQMATALAKADHARVGDLEAKLSFSER